MLALKTILLAIFVPGVFLFYIPLKILHSPINIGVNLFFLRYCAPFFWVIGAFLSLWCVWVFFSKGKGTPAPIDPPENLVVSGPYRYSRNPMYTGILSILFGHIIWFESFSLTMYFSALWVMFHLFIVNYEEPHLTEKFGESYKNYLKRVPRWIPRIPKNT